MKFCDRLKKLRQEKQLTQVQLSKLTNIGVTTINNYETGKYKPSIEKMKRLAMHLNTSIDDLVYDTELEELYTVSDDRPTSRFYQDPINSKSFEALSLRELNDFPIDDDKVSEKQLIRLTKNITLECLEMNARGIFKVLEYAQDISKNPKYRKKHPRNTQII